MPCLVSECERPLLTGEAADPAGRAEQTDSLSMACLLVLERLSPVERAVFLLHDASRASPRPLRGTPTAMTKCQGITAVSPCTQGLGPY